jgi:hypothetical protein
MFIVLVTCLDKPDGLEGDVVKSVEDVWTGSPRFDEDHRSRRRLSKSKGDCRGSSKFVEDCWSLSKIEIRIKLQMMYFIIHSTCS